MTEQLGLFDARSVRVGAERDAPLCVRESRRARRLTLRLLPSYVLELVVPRGTRAAEVAAFVSSQQRFIARARREIVARYATEAALPERLWLPAVGRAFDVAYGRAVQSARWRVDGARLRVETTGAPEEPAALLRAWLAAEGRRHLPPWLAREAERLGLRPSGVQVRLQRTRWGSCSGTGRISLNAALLFLEPAVVRYLLVHELCHLVALDHSARFWRTVERHEPDYRALDRRLRDARAELPLWVHAPP
jgi:predicted metal-dependent hydrolase